MASVSVDSKGNRIKTDVLVAGYIRSFGKEHKLLIPEPINDICFLFWFINICDEWDKESSGDDIKIDGQTVQNITRRIESIYGQQSVSNGCYSWRIRFNSKINWICIGIIEDKPEILQRYKTSSTYAYNGHGCFLFVYGGEAKLG